MQGLGSVRLAEEQPNARQVRASDRLVIAFAVAVHAADTLVVAADEAGKLAIHVDIGPLQEQPGRGREMRFVRPFFLGKPGHEEAFTEMLDLGVAGEKSG